MKPSKYLFTISLLLVFVFGSSSFAQSDEYDEFLQYLRAIENNNINEVKELIANGVSVNARNMHGRGTPIYYAISRDRIEILRLLLEAGAKVNIKNDDGDAPIHIAVKYNRFEALKALVEEGADINALDKSRNSALHNTIYFENKKLANLLLELNADIEVKDGFGCTPLCYAVEIGKYQMVVLLARKGADIDAPRKDKRTTVHNSTGYSDTKILVLLYLLGAKMDVKTDYGDTPLHSAVISENAKAIEFLVHNEKVDIHAKNSEDKNAAEIIAAEVYNIHGWVNHGNMEILKLLLDRGIQIKTSKSYGPEVNHLIFNTYPKKNFEYLHVLSEENFYRFLCNEVKSIERLNELVEIMLELQETIEPLSKLKIDLMNELATHLENPDSSTFCSHSRISLRIISSGI